MSKRRMSHTDIDWQQINTRLAQTAALAREGQKPSPERAALLLEERARRLAQPVAATRPAGLILDLLTFELAGERYGIDTRYVQEVARFGSLTPVPGVPEVVAGIANLRGRILVVFDIRPLFGLAPADATDMARILVCGDGHSDLGLFVDAASGVVRLPAEDLQPHDFPDDRNAANLVRGITRDAMVVLAGATLLTDQRLFVDHLRRQ